VQFPGTTPLAYALAMAEPDPSGIQIVDASAAAWGRLVQITSDLGDELGDIQVSVRTQNASRWRSASRRVSLAANPRVSVGALGGGAFWIAASGPTDGNILQLEGADIALTRVPVDELQNGPSDVPFYIRAAAPVVISGRVLSAAGDSVAGVLISAYEDLDKSASETVGASARRRLITEVTSDANGTFTIRGLHQQRYELLAADCCLGRASILIVPEGRQVILRLNAPKQVRGRVVREGQPLEHVPVVFIPTLTQFAMSVDPVEHLAFEVSTSAGGEFLLALPPKGDGELRIGSVSTGIVRIPLREADGRSVLEDVGEVELASKIRTRIMLNGWDSCELDAAGPLGSGGISIARAGHPAPGERTLVVPEPGAWWLTLTCDGLEVELDPRLIDVPAAGHESIFYLRVRTSERPR
jgi:hypothetical protein